MHLHFNDSKQDCATGAKMAKLAKQHTTSNRVAAVKHSYQNQGRPDLQVCKQFAIDGMQTCSMPCMEECCQTTLQLVSNCVMLTLLHGPMSTTVDLCVASYDVKST